MLNAIGFDTYMGEVVRGFQTSFDVKYSLQTSEIGNEENFRRTKRATLYFDPGTPAEQLPTVNDIDCVFGNPRNLQSLALMAKYTVTNEIPVMCYDIGFNFHLSHPDEVRRLYEDFFRYNGYRLCKILYNVSTWALGFSGSRMAYIAYKDRLNFNLAPPKLKRQRFLYDMISKFRSKRSEEGPTADEINNGAEWLPHQYVSLSQNEKLCIPNMYVGEGFAELYKYNRHVIPMELQMAADNSRSKDPFGIRFPRRCSWIVPLPSLHEFIYKYVHPDENRPLTKQEITEIAGIGSIPVGKDPFKQIAWSTPAPIAAWLAYLIKLHLENHWEGKDFYTNYNAKTGQWVGGKVLVKTDPKSYDMIRYLDYTWDPAQYPRPRDQRIRHYVSI